MQPDDQLDVADRFGLRRDRLQRPDVLLRRAEAVPGLAPAQLDLDSGAPPACELVERLGDPALGVLLRTYRQTAGAVVCRERLLMAYA